MKKLLILMLVLCVNGIPLPENKYAYMLAREKLKNMESGVLNIQTLNDKEKIVNFYFEKMKNDEFQSTQKYFYPARPIETEVNAIKNRTLYKMLKTLPKGGNLHIHEFQMLDRRVLLELIQASPEFDYLHICDKLNNPDCVGGPNLCGCSSYYLKYFAKQAPIGWVKVKNSNWTIDAILEKTTLTGILNNLDEKIYATDSNGRWATANQFGVFAFYSDLVKLNNTRFLYMKACLDSSLNESVQIVEFRRSNFGDLKYFDKEGNEVAIDARTELNYLLEFKRQYIQQNPQLIDFVFLIYGSRGRARSDILSDLSKAISIQKEYDTFIRGYDLVGEEDLGHTLLFHSDNLIEAFKYAQKSNGTFGLVLHTVETNWPDDFLLSKYGDDVSTMGNIYDSIVLRSHRIGHGLGLVKHPNLYPYLKQKGIAIEICPSSNQILGYTADLRNHPGINYYRSGIPIVLAGDDPGSFGYNELTIEYYLAYMAWGLNLYDLKTIATNSIKYSTIPDDIKDVGYLKFDREWNGFIEKWSQMACENELTSALGGLNFTDLQPAFGPSDRVNKISLFGYGFESLLCKNLTAVFGAGSEAKCELTGLNEISCGTPIVASQNQTVAFSFKANNKIIATSFQYTFLSSEFLSIVDDDVQTNKSNINRFLNFFFLIISFSFNLFLNY